MKDSILDENNTLETEKDSVGIKGRINYYSMKNPCGPSCGQGILMSGVFLVSLVNPRTKQVAKFDTKGCFITDFYCLPSMNKSKMYHYSSPDLRQQQDAVV